MDICSHHRTCGTLLRRAKSILYPQRPQQMRLLQQRLPVKERYTQTRITDSPISQFIDQTKKSDHIFLFDLNVLSLHPIFYT